jgi:hypothetical protein
MQNIESLSGIADGLKALARAIESSPELLKTAYQAGFLDGALAAAVVLLALHAIFQRNR